MCGSDSVIGWVDIGMGGKRQVEIFCNLCKSIGYSIKMFPGPIDLYSSGYDLMDHALLCVRFQIFILNMGFMGIKRCRN
jgi:hypothetical protein